jgi:hypothetical protein
MFHYGNKVRAFTVSMATLRHDHANGRRNRRRREAATDSGSQTAPKIGSKPRGYVAWTNAIVPSNYELEQRALKKQIAERG